MPAGEAPCLGPKGTKTDVIIPLTGPLLQELAGDTCGLDPTIPTLLSPNQNRYQVDYIGHRLRDNSPIIDYVEVTLDDGVTVNRFDLPEDDMWLIETSEGYEFEGMATVS